MTDLSANFSYLPGSEIGTVRLLIHDYDITAVSANYGERSSWSCVFSDEEIQVFLDQCDDNEFLAAALALRSMAANRALIAQYQKVTIGADSFDYGTMVKEITSQAESLERRAKQKDYEPATVVGGPINSLFDDAEQRAIDAYT